MIAPVASALSICSAAGEIANLRLSGDIVARGNDIKDLDDRSTTTVVSFGEIFDIQEVQLTPDGTRVIYLADDDYDGVIELYSVRVDGGDERPIKLHAALAPPHDSERDVIAFRIAPAGPGRATRVIYAVGEQGSYAFDLWSVEPDDPSTRAPLLPEGMFAEDPVGNFAVTPDGSQVVFNAFLEGSRDRGIFSVRSDDPATVMELSSGAADAGGTTSGPVEELLISPDGRWVVYVARRDNSHTSVFSAEVGVADSENHLNSTHTNDDSRLARHVVITADSSRVIFLGREFTSRTDLASAPIGGGSMIQLSTRGDGDASGFSIPADPSCGQVLYQTGGFNSSNPRLWLTPSGGGVVSRARNQFGGGAYRFSPDGCAYAFIDDGTLFSEIPGGGVQDISQDAASVVRSFAVHPDGDHITFLADRDAENVFELYTVPVGGGPATRIYQPQFRIDAYKLIEDSAGVPYVLFVGERDGDGVTRLFSAPALPGAPAGLENELSGGITGGGGVIPHLDHILLSRTEDRVVFTADRRIDGVIELFSVPLSGGDPVRLNRGNAPVGDASETWATVDTSDKTEDQPGGRRWVVYRADADVPGRHDLYAAPAKLESAPRRINEIVDRTSLKDTSGPVRFSSDGSCAFFLGPAEGSPFLKLFRHTFATGGTQQLSPDPSAPNSEVLAFRVHPTEPWLIYLADHRVTGVEELYRVNFADPDPQATVVKLTPDGDFQGVSEDFMITPDGGSIILRGDLRTKRQPELFRLEFADLNLTRLSRLQRDQARVLGFRLAIDPLAGTQALVFLADGDVEGQDELYVATPGGAVGAVPISGDLAVTGDVADDFAVSVGGRHAVFRADARNDGVFELFSVDLTGAFPARAELHAGSELQPPGVHEFVLNPSESQDPDRIEVAFRADLTPSEAGLDLLVATVGVERSAVRVSPMATHDEQEVESDYAFTADGGALLFRCDAPENAHFSLFKWSAGQAEASMMHPGFGGSETVLAFAASPDSYRVAYLVGDRRSKPGTLGEITTSPRRLFSTALEIPPVGEPEAARISLADGGFADVSDTLALAYLPDSSQLLFFDDRRKDETWELFTAYEPMQISPIHDRFIPADRVSDPIVFSIRDYETRPADVRVSAEASDPARIPNDGIVLTQNGAGWQLTLTPAAGAVGGPITITVRAAGNGDVAWESFEVCIGSEEDEYRAWLATFFGAAAIENPAVGGKLADPDRDGIPNLVEWGKRLNPSLADRHADHVVVGRADGEFVLRWRRAKPLSKAIRIGFEASGDFVSWLAISPSEEPIVVEDLGAAEIVETRFRIPVQEPGAWFLRMRFSTGSG